MAIWLISDTHFYHENIIKYCGRPFKSAAEMNSAMIGNWNRVVSDDDIVYHLGDFTMAPYEEGVPYKDRYEKVANSLLDILKGKKYLIRGNHDPRGGILQKCHWEDCYRELELNGFLLSHRPKESHVPNIHGHVHDQMPFWYLENNIDKFNVSADMIGFTPINFEVFTSMR